MDPHPLSITLERATPPMAASVRDLATAALGDSSYGASLLATLDGALTGESEEYRALVALRDRVVVGIVVFGETAGALGAGRIYLVVVDAAARDRGVASRLVNAACAELASRNARFAMIEVPLEPRLDRIRRLAERMGFREEGRIEDYLRNGIPLLMLVRPLTPTRSSSTA